MTDLEVLYQMSKDRLITLTKEPYEFFSQNSLYVAVCERDKSREYIVVSKDGWILSRGISFIQAYLVASQSFDDGCSSYGCY